MAVQPSPWQRSQGNVCLSFEEGLAGRQDSTFRIKESSLSLWDPCHTRTDVDPERRGLMLQHLWVPIPPGAAAAPRPQRGSQGAPVSPSRPAAGAPSRGFFRSLGCCGHTTPPARASSSPPPHLPRHLNVPRARYRALIAYLPRLRTIHSKSCQTYPYLSAPDSSQPGTKAPQKVLPMSLDLSTAIPHDPSDNTQ